MKAVTHFHIHNRFDSTDHFAVENFPTKKAFLKACGEIFDAEKDNSDLVITLKIIRIDK
jgi:hypothetical protein